ncbi:MAG TPA: mandelate racemase/muconate lactonizing enzyme family protein [Citreicella sp.]|nr:mandelate racemase/muconate lactonizing enzyme family protein [Citreicella sp.]
MTKIAKVETLSCDAGWRNYYFCKVTTEDGTIGWSEYDEGFGSPGVSEVIAKLGNRLIGLSVMDHERFHAEAYCLIRPAAGGIASQGIGALENALLDAKAKVLGVPCFELLGGRMRPAVPVYWSHCASWRINHPKVYGNGITTLDGVRQAGKEAREGGYKAAKTNLFLLDENSENPRSWRPGFAAPFHPELNPTPKLLRDLRAHLEAMIDGAGPEVEILLDLNFNFRTEGYVRALQAIADLPLFWVEIDSYSPDALAYIRSRSPHPISTGETFIGIREFLPFFQAQALDVAIVDTVWNGVWQSMKIANLAEAFEVNVAPHNFYGHLCTMMNAHFCSAVPNLRIMELDIDRTPWDADLFSAVPQVRDGMLQVPDTPGWGIEPVEAAIRARPPLQDAGLFRARPAA